MFGRCRFKRSFLLLVTSCRHPATPASVAQTWRRTWRNWKLVPRSWSAHRAACPTCCPERHSVSEHYLTSFISMHVKKIKTFLIKKQLLFVLKIRRASNCSSWTRPTRCCRAVSRNRSTTCSQRCLTTYKSSCCRPPCRRMCWTSRKSSWEIPSESWSRKRSSLLRVSSSSTSWSDVK